MSFFGDTLAHSALLGIAIGLATNSDPQLSIIVSGLVLAFLLSILERNTLVSTDALLGILAHSSLAIGVVFLALTEGVRVNIEAYLFGDMLTITSSSLAWICIISAVVGLTLFWFWNDLLSMTVHTELAEIEGINVPRLRLILIALTALTISVAIVSEILGTFARGFGGETQDITISPTVKSSIAMFVPLCGDNFTW